MLVIVMTAIVAPILFAVMVLRAWKNSDNI
jgi:hypothetical protein